jgi:manganese/zinc/iron transport system substrate-binding protein
MNRSTSRALALLSLLLFAAGCGPAQQGQGDVSGRPVKAVATTGMIGDLVAAIGGERVAVATLMGPGVDPHLYKASEGDVGRLAGADIIFYNGLHLEGKMSEVLEQLGSRVPTAAVAEVLDDERLLTPSEFKGAHDPHVWFDVSQWIDIAAGVRDRLTELDPGHAQVYRENAAAYIEKLEALHREVLRKAELIPADQRILVTAHDAFNYFGRAYGFQVRGLQGISTATEAGTADVQDLVSFIVEKQVPALFVESSVPVRTIEAVQSAVRDRGHEVAIGGQLYSDAMGNPGTFEGSYLGMVTHNIDTIVRAFGHDPASAAGAGDAVETGQASGQDTGH